MSKKLIAVASAAALALAGLVGIAPANAAATVIGFTTVTGAGTTASPYTTAVPHTNLLTGATNMMTITATNLLIGDTVTVTITGTAKVVDAQVTAASSLVNVSTLGASTITKTMTANESQILYVYGTVTAASTVAVSVTETETSGTKSTSGTSVVFKPTVGPVYKVTNLVTPATLALGATGEVTFNITDAFDNVIETNTETAAVVAASGADVEAGGVATWDATRELNVATLKSTVAATTPFILSIDGDSVATDPTNVGLGAVTILQTAVVNSVANATTTAALTAQIAALTAQIATMRTFERSVTKKRFNTLARKWNAAFPSQAVKLKPPLVK